MIMDTTTTALGVDNIDLPDAVAGEPTRYSPPGAIVQAAWLPIVEPEDVVETDQPLYPSPPKVGYIYRGFSVYRNPCVTIGRSPMSITCPASMFTNLIKPFELFLGPRPSSSPPGSPASINALIEQRHTLTCSVRARKFQMLKFW